MAAISFTGSSCVPHIEYWFFEITLSFICALSPSPLLSLSLANHSARSHYARIVFQKTEQLKVKKLPKLWQNYCFSFVISSHALYANGLVLWGFLLL